MGSSVFFDGWAGLLRILIVGPIAYAALVLLLRVGGKRTLTRMNAFDFVVTVSFGSVLASTLLSDDVPLLEGVLALTLLVALQYGVAWTEVRYERARRLVTSEPALLAWRGEQRLGTMRRERIGEDDVLAAVRASGHLSLDEVQAAILETDGSISVVPWERGASARRYIRPDRVRLHLGDSER